MLLTSTYCHNFSFGVVPSRTVCSASRSIRLGLYRKDATLEWGIIIVTILMLLNGVLCFALSTVAKSLDKMARDVNASKEVADDHIGRRASPHSTLHAPIYPLFNFIVNTDDFNRVGSSSQGYLVHTVVIITLAMLIVAMIRHQSWIATAGSGFLLLMCTLITMAKATSASFWADLVYKGGLMFICQLLLLFFAYRRELHERLRFQKLWNSAMDVTNNAFSTIYCLPRYAVECKWGDSSRRARQCRCDVCNDRKF